MNDITKTDIKNDIIDSANQKMTKGQIYGMLLYKYRLSTKEANSLIYEVLGKGKSNAANLDKVILCIRENYGHIDKSDLLAKMMAETGGTYSSENHRYAYIKNMIEYANQEVEAYKESMRKQVISNLDDF